MKKTYVFLLLFTPALILRVLSTLLAGISPQTLLSLMDFLGSALLFVSWAFFFWTIGELIQSLNSSKENEFPGIKIEDIAVHVEELGHDVHGKIMASTSFDERTPVVFLLTGGGGRHEDMLGLGSLLVKFGVKAVLFDHPGIVGRSHGSTPASKVRTPAKSILALRKVVDHVLSRGDMKARKVALFGGSLGAFTVVYGGFLDARIDVIIGQSAGLIEDREAMARVKKGMQWWFKLFCKLIKFDFEGLASLDYGQFSRVDDPRLRNKVFLLHTKDDVAVPYEAFLKLKSALHLPEENCLVFEKGGHGFARHQDTVYGWITGILRKHLF